MINLVPGLRPGTPSWRLCRSYREKGFRIFGGKWAWGEIRESEYQLWQESYHPQLVFSEAVLRNKLEYIHNNPVN